MKIWSELRNSWRGSHWTSRLSWFCAACLCALLMALYLQVLHMGMARADQLRLGQRTTLNTLAVRELAALPRNGSTGR